MQELSTQEWAQQLMAICHTAVAKAQAESHRLGVPNFYFIDGQPYYELPNGEFTQIPPDDFYAAGTHSSSDA